MQKYDAGMRNANKFLFSPGRHVERSEASPKPKEILHPDKSGFRMTGDDT